MDDGWTYFELEKIFIMSAIATITTLTIASAIKMNRISMEYTL